jgi:hypothetical protein
MRVTVDDQRKRAQESECPEPNEKRPTRCLCGALPRFGNQPAGERRCRTQRAEHKRVAEPEASACGQGLAAIASAREQDSESGEVIRPESMSDSVRESEQRGCEGGDQVDIHGALVPRSGSRSHCGGEDGSDSEQPIVDCALASRAMSRSRRERCRH